MDFSTSLLVTRDDASRDTLTRLGIHSSEGLSFTELFRQLELLKGTRGIWAKIATFRITEALLSFPVGRFLREAAGRSQLELVFDWCSHRHYGGISRTLIERELKMPLTDDNTTVRNLRCAGERYELFHPKLLMMGLSLPGGDELRLATFGSANMTAGGLANNVELGVLFAERGPGPLAHQTLLGWPEVSHAFEEWMRAARPITKSDLDYLPKDDAELHEWTETTAPSAVHLRRYQEEAVEAILLAWQSRYLKRPTANWKGTLLVLPPAAGKTICALEAARRIIRQDDNNRLVVWLSERPILAAQAYEEFERTGFLQREVMGLLVQGGRIRRSTGWGDFAVSDVPLKAWFDRSSSSPPAIVFTTKGEKKTIGILGENSPALSIVDEAHHAIAPEWRDALTKLRSYLVLGLTGTAYRKNPETKDTGDLLRRFSVGPHRWLDCFAPARQARLRKSFHVGDRVADDERVAYGVPFEKFYDTTFTGTEKAVLSKPTFVSIGVVDSKHQPVVVCAKGSTRQRIRFLENPFEATRDLATLVEDPDTVREALAAIDEDICQRAVEAAKSSRTTIIFARNVTHADILRRMLLSRHELVLALHSGDNRTRHERHQLLATVRAHSGYVLVCVDMLAEGVDLPNAGLLVMGRWTSSERLFWQMIGRGLRGPDIGGTESVDIVTYELQFGAPGSADILAGVQFVDDAILEAFGTHAHVYRPSPLQIDRQRLAPQRDSGSELTQGRPRMPRRRQGFMLARDIAAREELGLDGGAFDISVCYDDGEVAYERRGVRRPWRVLRELFDNNTFRGRMYRFCVSESA